MVIARHRRERLSDYGDYRTKIESEERLRLAGRYHMLVLFGQQENKMTIIVLTTIGAATIFAAIGALVIRTILGD